MRLTKHLQRDWSELIERVQQTGEPLFYAEGYANIILRIQALAENRDIPAETRALMIDALENQQRDLSARQYVEDFLAAAERHMAAHASLQRVVGSLGVPIVRDIGSPGLETGSGPSYGSGRDHPRGRGDIYEPSSRQYGKRQGARGTGNYLSCATSSGRMANMPPNARTPEPRSEPADTREKVEQPEPAEPAWMPAYEALRQNWNALIENARQTGIPSFYAKGYMDIIPRIRELTENPDIPAKSRAPLIQVLENHQRYLSTRKHILDYPGDVERHMDARASLQDVVADQEIEVTGVSAYPDWRQEAERLKAVGEAILSDQARCTVPILPGLWTARNHMTRGALGVSRGDPGGRRGAGRTAGARAAAPAKPPLGRSQVCVG